jgi:hypothetical protein
MHLRDRVGGSCREAEVHDEYIGASGKAGESFVAPVLIAPKHDAAITNADPVGERGHIAVGHADGAQFKVVVGPDR